LHALESRRAQLQHHCCGVLRPKHRGHVLFRCLRAMHAPDNVDLRACGGVAEHQGGTGEGGGGGRRDEVLFCLGLLPAAKEVAPGVRSSAARRGGEAVEGLGAEEEEEEEEEDTEKGTRHNIFGFGMGGGTCQLGFWEGGVDEAAWLLQTRTGGWPRMVVTLAQKRCRASGCGCGCGVVQRESEECCEGACALLVGEMTAEATRPGRRI
jgi:hypothetical protein